MLSFAIWSLTAPLHLLREWGFFLNNWRLQVAMHTCIHVHIYIFIAITRKAGSVLHPTSYIYRTSYMYPCIHASMHPCIRASVYPCICVSVYPCFRVSVFPCIHEAMLPNNRASIYRYNHNGGGLDQHRRCSTHNVIRTSMHQLEKVHWIIVFVFTLDCNNRIYCYDTEDGLVQQPSGWKSVAHWSVAMPPRMTNSP